jgi:hypothetical protein
LLASPAIFFPCQHYSNEYNGSKNSNDDYKSDSLVGAVRKCGVELSSQETIYVRRVRTRPSPKRLTQWRNDLVLIFSELIQAENNNSQIVVRDWWLIAHSLVIRACWSPLTLICLSEPYGSVDIAKVRSLSRERLVNINPGAPDHELNLGILAWTLKLGGHLCHDLSVSVRRWGNQYDLSSFIVYRKIGNTSVGRAIWSQFSG